MSDAVTTLPDAATRPLSHKLAATLAGALVVAAAAQIAIPIPGSPVPFTLQPLAVLIVGGLLGPRFGALSLITYLVLGVGGLPVFSPFGAPGLARLAGPTGGYLLAFPVAALAVGQAVRRSGGQLSYLRCFIAALLGMVVIFAGGLAQLWILSGNAGVALGVTPFALADLAKLALAALVIRRFGASTRALR